MRKPSPEHDKSLFDQIKHDVQDLAEQVRREHGDEFAQIFDRAKDEWRKFSSDFRSKAGEWREHANKHHAAARMYRSRHQAAFGQWPDVHEDGEAHFAFWAKRTRRTRGLLFVRLVVVFGFLGFLLLGGTVVTVWIASQILRTAGQLAGVAWFVGFLLAVGFLVGGGVIGYVAFQRVAAPLADVMQAADLVADGDLSVRVPVPERSPEQFVRLVRSFNRMTEEIQRADQQRRNLTADVAHELRTPLHIIQGNLEGILDGIYAPTEEHIMATLSETRALARLVEDLRTLSLAEAGQLPMEHADVDVAELLADAGTSFSGQAELAGISLEVRTEGSPDRMVIRGDAMRLDQVLSNLLGNALRHTPSGGTISLSACPSEDGVRITVRDTGEGIPKADLPYVFQRFWRGDRARTHSGGGGSGLGLAIARQLVQSHGGEIGVESEPGKGTTFVLDLPSAGVHPGPS